MVCMSYLSKEVYTTYSRPPPSTQTSICMNHVRVCSPGNGSAKVWGGGGNRGFGNLDLDLLLLLKSVGLKRKKLMYIYMFDYDV